ncbi:hypothetical protein CSB45_03000 [candidate division KSB3 bacterium]|uniref:Divergent polysaccharide deacetylase family protein n=1 Tax=candidate division KSB3 bacterium TaxID=2044937 RepID=A0A2G6E8U8_9BACT|nr:MAG: hypothetical protein CSB45_03000 [candidate division KSB3 bacterium]
MVTRKTIVYLSLCCLLIILGLILVNAFRKGEYIPLSVTRSTAPFPDKASERLSHSLQNIFEQSALIHAYRKTSVTPPDNGEERPGKRRQEYHARLERKAELPRVIERISTEIESHGGKIFQTYVDSHKQQAVIVIGVESAITHQLVLTWKPPVTTPTPPTTPSEPPARFRAAIIIDDLGSNLSFINSLLDLNADLTYSILPHLQKSTEIATMLHERQKEILLHLPMEPQDYPAISPGKGALFSRMTRDQIQRTIEWDLQSVPFASGVNNHMGSKLTSNWGAMKAVLEYLHAHKLFFVDSRTSGSTIAYTLAQQIGLQSAQRQVFLDVVPETQAVKAQLQKLALLAEQGKPAIAIGHPKSATLKALQNMLPEFRARHIQIVRISEFTH